MKHNNTIEIVPYNPEWPQRFAREAYRIRQALGDNCITIHHVGSTSVPELSAKPKIDIIAVVRQLSFPDHVLSAIGYTYRGYFNIPMRRCFTIRGASSSINLHVLEENDPEIELNLVFRDYLSKHHDARDEYEALKYALVLAESSHIKSESIYTGYTLGKNDFIQKILKRAGFNKHRFVLCTHSVEWDAAKHFRQKYFFDHNSVVDPYTWTFDHPGHKHVVLYQGTIIIGYAHILLWPAQRAAIRIIVIDEAKRRNNFGGQFLALCEKWLKNMAYQSIHVESAPSALSFYKKHGYVEMPFNDPDGYECGAEDIALGKRLH